ncbi:hypothetical protein HDZ31DRAFT_76140 [Schizophyllum fasciatum]
MASRDFKLSQSSALPPLRANYSETKSLLYEAMAQAELHLYGEEQRINMQTLARHLKNIKNIPSFSSLRNFAQGLGAPEVQQARVITEAYEAAQQVLPGAVAAAGIAMPISTSRELLSYSNPIHGAIAHGGRVPAAPDARNYEGRQRSIDYSYDPPRQSSYEAMPIGGLSPYTGTPATQRQPVATSSAAAPVNVSQPQVAFPGRSGHRAQVSAFGGQSPPSIAGSSRSGQSTRSAGSGISELASSHSARSSKRQDNTSSASRKRSSK